MNKNDLFNLDIKVGLIGCVGVGKSSIVLRFIQNIFMEEYDPFIEDEYRKFIDLNDKKLIFYILDTAGSEEHSFSINNWINLCELFVLVYSITNNSSFNDIFNFYHKRIEKMKKDYPKILIGNKSDLFTKRVVKTKEGKELAKKINCKFIETSAKNEENIYQLFYEVYLLAIEELKKNQKNQNKNKKGKCLLM